jgi:hypothetical protein
MNARITGGLTALLLAWIGACANGVDERASGTVEEGDGGAATAEGDAGPFEGGSGTSTPGTDDGGVAAFEDTGAATVGGSVDAGGTADAAPAPGTCDSLADCPYANATGVSGVSCDTTTHACAITCAGDNYDVNGLLSDGCEVANPCPVGNGTTLCPVEHAIATASSLGSFSCDDSSSTQNVTGAVPSDDRAHVAPAVVAFDGTAGAAPTVFTLVATGGLCEDDLNLTLQMKSPSTRLACYSLVAQVVGGTTYTCAQTDATGLCQITNGSGSYADGSTINLVVSKNDACPASETDDGAFEITGHL